MPIEVRVPPFGESINEARLGDWRKKSGEAVAADEVLIELESEKATFDLPAPSAGVLARVLKESGSTVTVGEVIAVIDETAASPSDKPASRPAVAPTAPSTSTGSKPAEPRVMPAAARVMHETGLSAEQVSPSGPGGRILKEDVEKAAKSAAPAKSSAVAKTSAAPKPPSVPAAAPVGGRQDEVVSMTLLRRRIAERLVQAKQTAALLTTFNEVDMSGVMEVRSRFKDSFQEKHGVKLGFMSFFVRAVVDALRAFPAVNAEIRGNDIVYHHYCDIGVAIGGGKGLVVPVLRNAETMGFAEIERRITDFGQRAKDNALLPDELTGGTFTISNGGVYGSMMSTPIVNPPQSGVLGMHAIQDRAVVKNGQIVVRPIMYIALTYDHRIVDGREGVSFLKRVKDSIEDPARLMLEV